MVLLLVQKDELIRLSVSDVSCTTAPVIKLDFTADFSTSRWLLEEAVWILKLQVNELFQLNVLGKTIIVALILITVMLVNDLQILFDLSFLASRRILFDALPAQAFWLAELFVSFVAAQLILFLFEETMLMMRVLAAANLTLTRA